MKRNVQSEKKILAAIQFVLIVSWVSHLVYTDSYFSVYALCCALAVVCLFDNISHERFMQKSAEILNIILSSLLSLAVILANYSIFLRIRDLNVISMSTNQFLNIFEAVFTFIGGLVVFYHILRWVATHFPVSSHVEMNSVSLKNIRWVFFGTFFFLSLIYLVYIFWVVYPGSVSGDSIIQIMQGAWNAYQNNHPIWHTVVIKLLLTLGYAVFEDPNAAVATYSVVQSLAMAACFAYALTTLFQIGIPRTWITLSFGIFAFLPYNIAYSATMWKDVPFGISMLLFTVAAFRIIRSVGRNTYLNYLFFFIGGIGVCTMRTNGWASLFVASILMLPYLWKVCRKIAILFATVIMLGWILVNPVLALLNVGESNIIEILSVPIQQVARVVTIGGELTTDELDMLSKVVDLEKVPLLYDANVSDELKEELFQTNREYLKENIGDYAKIWMNIGRRYPAEYLKAWIEQTKGYWNSGYDYYIYAEYVRDNDFGIYMVKQNNVIHKLVKAYFTLTRETVFFEPFQSIGLHVWIMVLLCFVNIVHRQKEAILFVPGFVIIAGLMLGAPVFSLFRYVYPIFTTIPFLLPVSLCRTGNGV